MEKVNGKCCLCFLGGAAIFVVLLLMTLSFKINSSNFPEGLLAGVLFMIAAVLIMVGCHNYKLTPKNK